MRWQLPPSWVQALDRPPARPLRPLAAALAAGAACALALALTTDALPLHQDTSRDLLLAAVCRQGGKCEGSMSSLPGVRHAAGWVELLSRLPADPSLLLALSVLAHALAAAATAASLAPHLRRAPLAAAAALSLAALPASTTFPVLWGPTLTVLPLSLLHLSLARLQDRIGVVPRVAFAALAGAALGAAVQGHIAHLLGVVVLLLGALLGPQAALSTLVSAAAFAAVAQPWKLWRLGLSQRVPPWALAALLGAAAAGAWLGRRSGAQTALGRQRLLAAGCLLGVGAAALAARSLHQAEWRYLTVALYPTLLASGLVCEALWARWPRALAVVLLAFVARTRLRLPPHPEQRLVDAASVHALAARWRGEGKSVEALMPRLRSARGWEELSGLAALGLPGQGPPLGRDVRLVAADRPLAPLLAASGWTEQVARSGGGLWASELDPWARFSQAQAFAALPGASRSPSLDEVPWKAPNRQYSYLRLDAWRRSSPPAGEGRPWRLAVPLRAADSEARSFVFLPTERWFRIAQVEDLPARINKSGSCALVQGPGAGVLVIETTAEGARVAPLFFPGLLEFRADEAALRDALLRQPTDAGDSGEPCGG